MASATSIALLSVTSAKGPGRPGTGTRERLGFTPKHLPMAKTQLRSTLHTWLFVAIQTGQDTPLATGHLDCASWIWIRRVVQQSEGSSISSQRCYCGSITNRVPLWDPQGRSPITGACKPYKPQAGGLEHGIVVLRSEDRRICLYTSTRP